MRVKIDRSEEYYHCRTSLQLDSLRGATPPLSYRGQIGGRYRYQQYRQTYFLSLQIPLLQRAVSIYTSLMREKGIREYWHWTVQTISTGTSVLIIQVPLSYTLYNLSLKRGTDNQTIINNSLQSSYLQILSIYIGYKIRAILITYPNGYRIGQSIFNLVSTRIQSHYTRIQSTNVTFAVVKG